LFFVSPIIAEKAKSIDLPPPQTKIGKPLMKTLKLRKSNRTFSKKTLPLQTLSNLLWAAWGINRPKSGKRTAPSPRNWQQIKIYLAMEDSLYLYDAKLNKLKLILKKDIRDATGLQSFVKEAPLNLIYVADYSKIGNNVPLKQKRFYSGITTGFISQNVYLYCASEGLSTVVRGLFDAKKLRAIMNLEENLKIILTQTVGHPAK